MANFELKLPDMGEGVVEGEIVKWLVQPGDSVTEDQPLLEVMTDKATVTVPSPKRGKVVQTHGKEGEMAKVHSLLVTLELADGDAPAAAPAKAASAAAKSGKAPVAKESSAALAYEEAPLESVKDDNKVLATPVTRRMAKEHGLNLAQISGSGPQGRVTKADVEAALQAPARAPAAVTPIRGGAADQRLPLKGLRKRIAEKMVRSKFTAPHFTFVEEVDVTELSLLRKRVNEQLAEGGENLKLSFLPFLCKALVPALRAFPHLNANFDDATQELVVRGSFHFGIAASTPEGLTVPVVKDVERRSLRELAEEISRLATAARERRLSLDELSGGSFTLTSLGQHGGLMATPIINYPEVAILGIHRIRQRPAVVDGQIVIRDTMNVSLSFDHRVIDGQVGADFTYALIRYLEHPELLFVDMA